MNVLLLGSGGREHAFALKISESSLCSRLYIAPGNAGTRQCGTNVEISVTDFDSIGKFCLSHSIQLVIVGPEDPLVKGITDFFLNDNNLKNIPVIGPDKNGAQLEGSKDFAKQFMARNHIPTARYKSFNKQSLEKGLQFLETLQPPYVLKADGLAAGKGVVIHESLNDAKRELQSMLTGNKFGSAGSKVVIEEFLKGVELSIFVLTDGKSYQILPAAKDYKRIGDGDTGLNTGGMGAISPPPFATPEFLKKVEQKIIIPTIVGLKNEQINYQGFIFIGLMKVGDEPYVIEYNCRMGDPETEAVLPRIKNDFLELMIGVANGNLENFKLETDSRIATTVVMVSGGYPEQYEKGKTIIGIERVSGKNLVFHAGTQISQDHIVTSGGRVLAITALDNNLEGAVKKVYEEVEKIKFENHYYRKDIGKDMADLL